MAGATLDLRKAHLSRFHGDLAAIYTWMGMGQDSEERALVLLPHRRPGAPWFVVMESAAWRYDDPRYLAMQAAKACEVLGMEPSKPNWVRVASIINEGLPDLVRMPSAPPPEFLRGTFGHMILREDGKPIAEEAIKVEATGVEYGAV